MVDCPHGHSMPDSIALSLPASQGGTGRHKCAICAYGLAVTYAGAIGPTEACIHDCRAPTAVLASLPTYQGGLTRHRCAVCSFLEGLASGPATPDTDTVEVADQLLQGQEGIVEGNVVWRRHRSYERDPRNRAKAILYHGNLCFGCGFSFDAVYTPGHARSYIEVHHIRPLREGPAVVDPYSDLIPLCANCHRMVHRNSNQPLTLVELQQLLAQASSDASEGLGYP